MENSQILQQKHFASRDHFGDILQKRRQKMRWFWIREVAVEIQEWLNGVNEGSDDWIHVIGEDDGHCWLADPTSIAFPHSFLV